MSFGKLGAMGRGFGRMGNVLGTGTSNPSVVVPDLTNYQKGNWTLFLNPYNKVSLGLTGSDSATVYPATFPNGTVCTWTWPTRTPGIPIGFNQLAIYGDYFNTAALTPIPATQINAITVLSALQTFSLTGGTNNYASCLDYFLTDAPNAHGVGNHKCEIQIHLTAPAYIQSYVASIGGAVTGAQLGTVTISGIQFTVARDDTANSGAYPDFVFMPTDLANHTSTVLDLNYLHQWLIGLGQITATWYYNGHAFGTEPTSGPGSMTLTACSAFYLPANQEFLLTGAAVEADFANSRYYGGTLANMLTVTNSGGYARNSDGTLTSFSSNTARIGSGTGLLVERAATNICTQSQFASGWTGTNVVQGVNAVIAPDGTTTALQLTDNGVAGSHLVSSTNMSFTSGQPYVFSCFVRNGTLGFAQLTAGGAAFSGGGAVNINLSTGAIQTVGTVTGSGVDTYADSSGNTWYRVWFSATATATASTGVILCMATAVNSVRTVSYTGTGKTIFGWGFQAEQSDATHLYPTSYVPTTTTSVLRSADAIVAAGALLTTLRSSAMSVRVQTNTFKSANAASLIHDTTNSHVLLGYSASQNGTTSFNSSGTALASTTGTALQAITSAVMLAGSASGRSICTNNAVVATDANAIQAFTAASIGADGSGTNALDGYIGRIDAWTSRQTDATLHANLSPVRCVSTRGHIPSGALVQATTSATLCLEGRTRHVITDDTPFIRFSDVGYYLLAAGETVVGNDTTIECAMEIPTLSQTVRATYSGANTGTIPNGSAEYLSDRVYAASFGLTSFTRGTVFWRRVRRTVTINQFYPAFEVNGTGVTGEQAYLSDGASASQVMGSGAMSTPSGGSVANYAVVPANIIGYAPGNICPYGIGDSIMDASDDNAGDGNSGGGWFARGLLSVNSRQLAWSRAGRGSSTVQTFDASFTKRLAQFKYHSHGVIHYGTNDMSPFGSNRSAAQAYADLLTSAGIMKAGGIGRIAASKVIPRTNSAAAPASQVPETGFETGGTKRDPFNTSLAAAPGTTSIDEVFDMSSTIADATLTDRWISSATSGGIHPNVSGSSLMAPVFNAIAAAWS